jgi:hypothetical protein
MRRKAKEIISVYVVASVVYGLFALVLAFPFHPITILGWAIWFVAALPIAGVGEAVGSTIFDKRIGEAISDDTDKVSVSRVAYGVVAALLFFATIWIVVLLLDVGRSDFWDTHFSSNW